jgi:hypothetical protein
LAGLALTGHGAYGLSVAPTPPTSEAITPEATRIAGDLEPWSRVVSAHDGGSLHDVVTDGDDRQQQFIGGGRSWGLHPLGQRRAEAKRRSLYQGPQGPGPGRPKTYDGKVHWRDRSRLEQVDPEDDPSVRYHPRLHQVPCQCHRGVVVGVDTPRHRRAVRLSPDGALDARPLARSDKARVHMEWLCRDATPLTGLTDGQARSPATLACHGKASVTAVRLAKREARPQSGQAPSSCSMARLKRRAVNQPLIDRMCVYFANGHSLEKSSPAYDTLCHYGLITELAA